MNQVNSSNGLAIMTAL